MLESFGESIWSHHDNKKEVSKSKYASKLRCKSIPCWKKILLIFLSKIDLAWRRALELDGNLPQICVELISQARGPAQKIDDNVFLITAYVTAERQRIDAFELWCWRRLLRVPWTARRPNQSLLKEISPGCSLEGLMLKLKLQYFGHLMRRVESLEKTWCWEGLGAGGEGDDRGWDGWMASPIQCTWVWVNSGSWWWTGRPGVLRFMGLQRVGHDWVTELNWIPVYSRIHSNGTR